MWLFNFIFEDNFTANTIFQKKGCNNLFISYLLQKIFRERSGSKMSEIQQITSVVRRKKYKTKKKPVYDVIIIGGCVTGVSTALLLQKAGLKVALLEYSKIGFLTSGSYTTHLNAYYDALNNDIVQQLDFDSLKLYAEAGKDALKLIESNIAAYNIECEFAPAESYVFSVTKSQEPVLDNIVAVGELVGTGAKYTEKSPFKIPYTKIAAISGQSTLHAVKYISALLAEFKNLGGYVLERCRVLKIEQENNIQLVYSSRGKLQCRKILYTPQTSRILNLKPFRFIPYVHYTVAARLDKNSNTAIAYDAAQPCHRFIAYEKDGDHMLAVRGEDHRVVKGKRREVYFHRLEQKIINHFNAEEIIAKWSYVYYKTDKGLPHIGAIQGTDRYISAGYNPDGMILASLGSLIISGLILNGHSKYENLFPAKADKMTPSAMGRLDEISV